MDKEQLLAPLLADGNPKTAKAILEGERSLQALEHLYNKLSDKR